jgi:hypothetical protein
VQDPLASDYVNDNILYEYCYNLSFWKDLKELTFILIITSGIAPIPTAGAIKESSTTNSR